jgi:hypothetical protein
MKAGDEEERGRKPSGGGSEPGSRRAFRPCCPAATRGRDGSVFFPCFFPCGAQPRIDCQIKSVELFVGPGLRCVVRPDLEVPVEIHFFFNRLVGDEGSSSLLTYTNECQNRWWY